jgi:hypothetical protein
MLHVCCPWKPSWPVKVLSCKQYCLWPIFVVHVPAFAAHVSLTFVMHSSAGSAGVSCALSCLERPHLLRTCTELPQICCALNCLKRLRPAPAV